MPDHSSDPAARSGSPSSSWQVVAIAGSAALSPFRRDRLLAEMQARVPALASIDARYWHFAAIEHPLADNERAVLERILTYGPRSEAPPAGAVGTALLVIPRLGTISPWASKATDIARHCGLGRIHRLERGVAWTFTRRDGGPLTAAERESLVPLIHDRMTENVLPDFQQVDELFREATPAPLRTVDIIGGGRVALAAAGAWR